MTFDEQLREHIATLNCTAKELAFTSNMTQATLSRYCNGIRVPQANSIEVDSLAKGISTLANEITSKESASADEALQKLTDYTFVKETLIATLAVCLLYTSPSPRD